MQNIIPQDDTPEKKCKGPCGETYPATTDFFYKSPRGIFDVGPYCKKCHVQLNTERRRNLPPEKKERMRAKGRKYYHTHKETMQGRHKHWYQANREYVLEKDRRFRIDHPEILAQRWQNWYQTENGKERSRTRVRNRRARKEATPGTHTPEEIRAQYDRQKGKCYYCGKKVKWGDHWVDHTFPISREFARNSIDHLVITCEPCNESKGNKYPWEWPQGNRLL